MKNEDTIGNRVNEVYTRHANAYHMKRRHECNAVTITNYHKELQEYAKRIFQVQKDTEYDFGLL